MIWKGLHAGGLYANDDHPRNDSWALSPHGGCAFSASLLTRTAAFTLRTIPHGLFSLFFPSDCHICGDALAEFTRVPVCRECLASPAAGTDAEFFCALCHAAFQNSFALDDQGVCALCRSGLRAFDRAVSFGAYEGTLRRLIHLFKYSGMRPLGGRLAQLLDHAIPADGAARFDVIVPVPLHWRRRWQRGFNQAEVLSREIGRRRRIPVVRALSRRRATPSQSGLTSAARRRNTAGAFRAAGPDIAGKKVLLIDDVMTTGATAAACARSLLAAGAESVSVATLARADRRLRHDV